MFVLRRINEESVEVNTYLGIYYTLILASKNKAEFCKTTEQWKMDDLEGVYGVITFDDADSIMPLYEGSEYYIMTDSGKTFAKV
jgi:hypothetical protein